MDINTIWSAALSLLMGALWFFIREKFDEIKRLDILLNKTREENHRDFITKAERRLQYERNNKIEEGV